MQETITAVLGEYGYWGVFVLIAVENIFPPIPSEVILTFSGFLTTVTQLHIWGVIFAATLGSVAGAAVLYGAGRVLSGQRLALFLDGKVGKALHFEREDVEKAAAWFAQKGWPCVLYCRCVPIVRSLISIPAGMAGMKLLPFFALTTVGSLVWNIVLVHLGAWAGQSWPAVTAFLENASIGVKVTLWIAVGLGAFWLYKRRRKPYNKSIQKEIEDVS